MWRTPNLCVEFSGIFKKNLGLNYLTLVCLSIMWQIPDLCTLCAKYLSCIFVRIPHFWCVDPPCNELRTLPCNSEKYLRWIFVWIIRFPCVRWFFNQLQIFLSHWAKYFDITLLGSIPISCVGRFCNQLHIFMSNWAPHLKRIFNEL